MSQNIYKIVWNLKEKNFNYYNTFSIERVLILQLKYLENRHNPRNKEKELWHILLQIVTFTFSKVPAIDSLEGPADLSWEPVCVLLRHSSERQGYLTSQPVADWKQLSGETGRKCTWGPAGPSKRWPGQYGKTCRIYSESVGHGALRRLQWVEWLYQPYKSLVASVCITL